MEELENVNCVICNKEIQKGNDIVKLKDKSSESVNTASEKRGSRIKTCPGQIVHKECRRCFCEPNRISSDKSKAQQSNEAYQNISLRSEKERFEFKVHCLFCGLPAIKDGKRKNSDVWPVKSLGFQETVRKQCVARNHDEWAQIVSGRLACVNDLRAADAVYHEKCSIKFRFGQQMPGLAHEQTHTTKKGKTGRPEQEEKAAAFLRVATYFEDNDDEQLTVSDLVEKMEEYLQDTEYQAYSMVYMKKKILEHFSNRIIITELNGKPNVVTFFSTASSILHDFHKQSKHDTSEKDKLSIIKTAAKLILSDIKSLTVSNDQYPSTEEMLSASAEDSYLPATLQLLLRTMFAGKKTNVKVASIGQAIIQATRPRVLLAPLQLGLGLQMHHHYSSRFLIDTLNSLGFSCSYSEVQRYERSAAVAQGTDIPDHTPGQQIQYVADNVDHNVCTLDGAGTFHGMGIIAIKTPGSSKCKPVPKVSISSAEIAAIGQISIEYFKPTPTLPLLVYKSIVNLDIKDPTFNLDLLWKSSLLLHTTRPGWSGMMQMVNAGQHPGKSSVTFLPMIDLQSSNPSCVLSTLRFVSSHAARYNVTPVLTFDQPLYWKALTIVRSQPSNSDLRNIVLRLGGLHTEMSFLGSIGHLMGGSGLQEVLGVVYAENTVSHMLSGKAISRAVRGHLLVDAALNTILLSESYNVPVPSSSTDAENTEQLNAGEENVEGAIPNESNRNRELQETRQLYDSLLSGSASVDETCSSGILNQIQNNLEMKKNCQLSRTALLWLQYMKMIDILRMFLKAERTGNWALHLQAVHDMLPYFAASGHNLYAKSAHIYLQMMQELPQTHPDVYKSFNEGYHVVRRSDRYWAGLSSDLTIEQVLMRSLKTSGGLTRGTGMTETQRNVWLLSLPSRAHVNEVMQQFSGVQYETSEQHKEVGKARQCRDVNDTLAILSYLMERSPFSSDLVLRSIATGMTSESSVNVDMSKAVGQKILDGMVGKNVNDYSFKKSEQAVTLSSKTSIKIQDQQVQVDPKLLFQRLLTLGDRADDLPHLFTFELCSYPPALFESSRLPLPANKSVLADALWKLAGNECPQPTDNVKFVLDGGALLHRIPWPRGATYEHICQLYIDYVAKKYGKPTVVFDGYHNGPSTKDATHLRRSGTRKGVTVHFTREMVLKSNKDEFLANEANKQLFINLLSERMEQAGCVTIHAQQDADLLIVRTAVQSAEVNDIIVVGDDTDLLVLLIYHTDLRAKQVFFAPEVKANSKKNRVWNIKHLKNTLGGDVCHNILFIHAILGCDTVSRIHGLGKGVGLKKLKNAVFHQQALVFNTSTSIDKQGLVTAGEKALVCLYNGDASDSLDTLRYKRFCDKVSTNKSFVEPQTLPPTSSAGKYHSLRVFYQIQEWKGLADGLVPSDWGWNLDNGM